jgi:uncharacterized membrane protein YqhA
VFVLKRRFNTVINKSKKLEKSLKYISAVIAIILGVTLFKQFNFETFQFKKPSLAVVYAVGFVLSLFLYFKKSKLQ